MSSGLKEWPIMSRLERGRYIFVSLSYGAFLGMVIGMLLNYDEIQRQGVGLPFSFYVSSFVIGFLVLVFQCLRVVDSIRRPEAKSEAPYRASLLSLQTNLQMTVWIVLIFVTVGIAFIKG